MDSRRCRCSCEWWWDGDRDLLPSGVQVKVPLRGGDQMACRQPRYWPNQVVRATMAAAVITPTLSTGWAPGTVQAPHLQHLNNHAWSSSVLRHSCPQRPVSWREPSPWGLSDPLLDIQTLPPSPPASSPLSLLRFTPEHRSQATRPLLQTHSSCLPD